MTSSGYIRQSAAQIVTGNTIQASDFNNEYNQLQSAFDGTSGHDHSGGTGLGPKVSLTTSISGILPPNNGGTGIANNIASTLAISGSFATTLTVTGATGVTLPTTGTLATLAGAETLTNKTLTSPVISTITNTGTITLPTSTDTLVGRATTDTLTNKTLTSPTINGATIATGTINNTVIGGSIPAAGTFSTLTSSGAAITGGTIDNTTIGATTATTGKFTNVIVTGSSIPSSVGIYAPSAFNFGVAIQGVQQFAVAGSSSTVNFAKATGAATGFYPSISATGTDTNIGLNLQSQGNASLFFETNSVSPQVQLTVSHTATAANNINITGAIASSGPIISSQGSDTNVDININPKGSGQVKLGTPLTGTYIASNVALAGNPTTTTPTAADNSTKIATTAFVNGTALTLASGTTATTQSVGDASTKVATTAFVNPGFSLSGGGYCELPSGLILQWGHAASGSVAQINTTYPIAFTTACYSIVVTSNYTVGGFGFVNVDGSPSTTSFSASQYNGGGTLVAPLFYWYAVGK